MIEICGYCGEVSLTWTHDAYVEVTGAARFYRAASLWTAGLGYLCLSNSSSAKPMSLAIWRSKIGEMSRP